MYPNILIDDGGAQLHGLGIGYLLLFLMSVDMFKKSKTYISFPGKKFYATSYLRWHSVSKPLGLKMWKRLGWFYCTLNTNIGAKPTSGNFCLGAACTFCWYWFHGRCWTKMCIAKHYCCAILGSWIHSFMYHPQWPSDFANAILMRPTGVCTNTIKPIIVHNLN